MPQNHRRSLVALALAFYLLVTAGVFVTTWHAMAGHFGYALDDAYIHMALAVQLSHGHYGINAGEASSPSSSILWPFLLTPFASNGFHLYLPLVLNLLAGLVSATLIGIAVSEWPSPPGDKDDRWFRYIAVISLVLIGNLVGLTFLGMEHTLQVMLAICCAMGICRVLSGRTLPTWCIAAAAIAPMVRYEDLALTLAIAVTLYGMRKRRQALLLVVVAILPLIVFSAFLHSRGLPLLPLSVLVKGKAAEGHVNIGFTAARTLAAGVYHTFVETSRWPMLALLLMLSAAAWRERERTRRFALTAAAGATALHLLIGRFGWLHRYEVYALVFAAIIVLRLLQEYQMPRLGWYVMGLLVLIMPYAQAIPDSVLSAQDVYGDQYQAHRFSTEFYSGNVGVMDLGEVSYKIGNGRYVLDLLGLGSLEAARQPVKSDAWREQIVREHDVGLLMISPQIILPAGWTELGRTCLVREAVIRGPCVEYISTKPEEAAALKVKFAAFARTLPSQTYAVFPPEP
jgi:hypothetical protein